MRSALFVPGDSERKLEKALGSGADALFIDFEDSVALDAKETARNLTREFLKSTVGQPERPALYVRVNALDTGLTDEDLQFAMAGQPDGLVLPKSNHGKDVTALHAQMRVHEAENDVADGSTAIIAIITETAAGVLNAATYEDRSSRLRAVSWGAEDLSADIGALQRRRPDGAYRDTFRFARVQTLLGAVAAQVQPLDTVYPDFRDEAGFRRECEEAAIDGFTGKMAIHPAQVPVINEVFTPSQDAVDEAQAIVDAFEAAGHPGVLAMDGQMLDRPHYIKAERLLARAAAIKA